MNTIKIAAIQLCSTRDREQNLDKAKSLMEKAVDAGAQLIALPENFTFLGKESEKLEAAEEPGTGPGWKFLQAFAKSHKVAVVGGSLPIVTEDKQKVTNTCLVFDPEGELVARYDKMHLFDVSIDEENTFLESRLVEPGKNIATAKLFGITMGLTICYDLRFPELYRRLMLAGAKVLFIPAAFTLMTGKDHWLPLIRARAIENQCYVVAPAQYGQHIPGRTSYGHSVIVDPWGHVVSQCSDKEGFIVGELDMDFLDKTRLKVPCLTHLKEELL